MRITLSGITLLEQSRPVHDATWNVRYPTPLEVPELKPLVHALTRLQRRRLSEPRSRLDTFHSAIRQVAKRSTRFSSGGQEPVQLPVIQS
jgi:hypothetical protein